MILAATGHRPDRLGGYSPKVDQALYHMARGYIEARPDVSGVISGMALGWDMVVARAAIQTNRVVIAAIPFRGQESKWPRQSQDLYREILAHARVVEVCAPGYANWKFQKRNEWMVDHSDHIVALWDGSPGGTANCIGYAQSRGRHYDNLWDRWKSGR